MSAGIISASFNLLPREIVWAINCRRFVKYWREAEVIFVHVPKAAGTSFSTALYGRHLGHLRAQDMRRYVPSDFNRLFKFAFVRNPWDRLYSAYHFVRQGGTELVPVNKPEQYQAKCFATFEVFIKDWLVRQDLMQLDYVFMPQHTFFAGESGENIVDYVGRMEHLSRDVAVVTERLGRPINVGEVNVVKKSQDYRSAYTPELINLVGDLYRRDIEITGYDF